MLLKISLTSTSSILSKLDSEMAEPLTNHTSHQELVYSDLFKILKAAIFSHFMAEVQENQDMSWKGGECGAHGGGVDSEPRPVRRGGPRRLR